MFRIYRLEVVAGVVLAAFSATTSALDLTAGAGAAHNCPDGSYGLAFNASAIAYLEPAPVVTVDDYGGGHYSPSNGNDIGIGVGYSELTGEAYGFCVGVLFRAEYRAEASEDLLDALVANHFGHTFDAGRTYRLSLKEDSFKADGARVRRVFGFDLTDQWSTKLGFGASLLKATEGQDDSLSGKVTATSANYAVGTGTWLQTASNLNLENFNPFVAAGNPSAYGFSTDFELISKSKAGWSMDFIVIDALGRLYWHDIPRSLRTLNNASISYNANFDRDAFINGIDSRINYVQDLAPKYHLVFTAPALSNLGAYIEDDFVDGLHFPSLGARYGSEGRLAEVNYDFRTKAVGVGGQLRAITALVTTNDIRIRSATVLGISIQAVHSW
jgi:hypothetical protein